MTKPPMMASGQTLKLVPMTNGHRGHARPPSMAKTGLRWFPSTLHSSTLTSLVLSVLLRVELCGS